MNVNGHPVGAVYARSYGSTVVTLLAYSDGVRHMVAQPFLETGLAPTALKIAERARGIAPRTGLDTTARRGDKPYHRSFEVSTGVLPAPRASYNTESDAIRAYARVTANNWFALYIEYGNARIRAYRTLRTAAGIADG
jgi:hypothetical protein